MLRALGCFVTAIGIQHVSIAWAQSDIAAVQLWLDTQSQLGAQVGDDLGVEAEWKRWMAVEADERTVAFLSQDLSKTPDHPLHGRQAETRKRILEGMTTRHYLAAADRRWRIGYQEVDKPTARWHSGGTHDDGWMWSDSEVMVVNVDHPPESRDYPSLRFECLRAVLGMLSGGLAEVAPRKVTWKVIQVSGGRWSAAQVKDDLSTQNREAFGTWNSSATDEAGRVERIIVTKLDGSPMYEVRNSDWRNHDGLLAATTCEVVVRGKVVERTELISMKRVEAARVKALAAVPGPQAPDPLLGETSAVRVVDLRSARPTVSALGPEGMVDMPVIETPGMKSQRRLRYAGWGIGTGVVVIGAALWWRKRAAAR